MLKSDGTDGEYMDVVEGEARAMVKLLVMAVLSRYLAVGWIIALTVYPRQSGGSVSAS